MSNDLPVTVAVGVRPRLVQRGGREYLDVSNLARGGAEIVRADRRAKSLGSQGTQHYSALTPGPDFGSRTGTELPNRDVTKLRYASGGATNDGVSDARSRYDGHTGKRCTLIDTRLKRAILFNCHRSERPTRARVFRASGGPRHE
jgi:hypothetical protein